MDNNNISGFDKTISSRDIEESSGDIHISLVINEFITEKINLKRDDDINSKCEQICDKYNLSKAIKKKLNEKILAQIKLHDITEKNKEEERKNKIIDRLYYKSIENKNKISEKMKQINKSESEKRTKENTFTPGISASSQRYDNFRKDYNKLEEKLLKQGIKREHSLQMKRISSAIQKREECKQFVYKKEKKQKEKHKPLCLNKEEEKKVDEGVSRITGQFRQDEEVKDKEKINPSILERNLKKKSLDSTTTDNTLSKIIKQNEQISFLRKASIITESPIEETCKTISNTSQHVKRSEIKTKTNAFASQSTLNKDLTNYNPTHLKQSLFTTRTSHKKQSTMMEIKPSFRQASEDNMFNYKASSKNSSNNTINNLNSYSELYKQQQNLNILNAIKHSSGYESSTNYTRLGLRRLSASINNSDFKFSANDINKSKSPDHGIKKNRSSVELMNYKSKTLNKISIKGPSDLHVKKDFSIPIQKEDKSVQVDQTPCDNLKKPMSPTKPKNKLYDSRLVEKLNQINTNLPKIYKKLSSSQDKIRKRKEESYLFIQSKICPFTPQLNKKSKLLNSRSHTNVFKRLNENKRCPLADLDMIRSQSANNIRKRSLSPIKRNSTHIREIKEQMDLCNSLEIFRTLNSKLKSEAVKKFNMNLHDFKLNNLKEIFNKVTEVCRSSNDFALLYDLKIPKMIIDKMIIPALQIMFFRGMEFNFKNFYCVSNEIMNFIL